MRPWLASSLLLAALLAAGLSGRALAQAGGEGPAGAGASAVSGVASPAAAGSGESVTLTLTAREEGNGRFVTLLARLTDATGRPLGMRTVEFLFVPDFLAGSGQFTGRHPVRIGQAKTNVTGTARLRWQPALTGPAEVRARVVDDERLLGAETRLTVDLKRIESPEPRAIRPLARVRRLTAVAAWGLTIGVWVLLGLTTGFTLSAIRQAGRKAQAERQQERGEPREVPSAG